MDSNKIILFINTIKFLKPVQVFYRLFYFLRNKFFKCNVKKVIIHDHNPIVWKNRLNNNNSFFPKSNSFTFLNNSHSFYDEIN